MEVIYGRRIRETFEGDRRGPLSAPRRPDRDRHLLDVPSTSSYSPPQLRYLWHASLISVVGLVCLMDEGKPLCVSTTLQRERAIIEALVGCQSGLRGNPSLAGFFVKREALVMSSSLL